MPLYEYACQSCQHHFDIRHSANETPALRCPECDGEVKKVFHAAGIIFKGSGWHIKDYANKSAVTGESKEDAKPEPKTETKAPETKAPEKKEPVTASAASE